MTRRSVVLAAVLLTACDKPAAPVARPKVAAGPGKITGVVRMVGDKPAAKVVGGDCCPGASPVVDESFAGNGPALANVAVWIDDGPNLDTPARPTAVLTQRDCRYEPHVLAVQTGQLLTVTSHDPTTHNVHYTSGKNSGDNFGQQNNDSKRLTFDHPDTIKFSCDVHPWMRATVRVFDHPCFAVTDAEGEFQIGSLPPGTYTVRAEHERLGPLQSTVTVSGDKPLELNFEYRR